MAGCGVVCGMMRSLHITTYNIEFFTFRSREHRGKQTETYASCIQVKSGKQRLSSRARHLDPNTMPYELKGRNVLVTGGSAYVFFFYTWSYIYHIHAFLSFNIHGDIVRVLLVYFSSSLSQSRCIFALVLFSIGQHTNLTDVFSLNELRKCASPMFLTTIYFGYA